MESKLIRDKLCNDFPSVYIKEIDSALKTFNNSYTATYYHLEDQLKKNNLKIKKIVGKQRVVNSIPKLEYIFKSVKHTFECSCCCDEKSMDEFSQCTDGHLICRVCIKKHAENTIYQKLSCKIKCI